MLLILKPSLKTSFMVVSTTRLSNGLMVSSQECSEKSLKIKEVSQARGTGLYSMVMLTLNGPKT